ncbi:hypothetical protein RRG08_038635 [Elysia crispata]|uniref:Uncharacterized protein n=1 Tax=Elysia crispata TaxID=231223 RepID=A0AAE0YKJ4_9GAST|nr:hypothetical protein RRG08_038635 [Elysia crispata]
MPDGDQSVLIDLKVLLLKPEWDNWVNTTPSASRGRVYGGESPAPTAPVLTPGLGPEYSPSLLYTAGCVP